MFFSISILRILILICQFGINSLSYRLTVMSLYVCHCVAGGYHWLPLYTSNFSFLPTGFGQDRQLLHDRLLCSTCDYCFTCQLGTCCFLSGLMEHLPGRYSSGSGHRSRSCFGYPCELSNGAFSGSTSVLTSSNFTDSQH